MTVQEVYIFLAVIIQKGHDVRDTMKSLWSSVEQFYTQCYSNAMKRGWFIRILRFLYFSDNMSLPDKKD
jgi:hypothetical protein